MSTKLSLTFTVPGEPLAWQRAAPVILKRCKEEGCGAKTVKNTCPRCGSDRMEMLTTLDHVPKQTAIYQNQVALMARQAMLEAGIERLLEGPLKLEIVCRLLIPASRKRLREGQPVSQRPDASNLLKNIEDGMSKVVFADDRQIAEVHLVKVWTAHPPSATVRVSELEPLPFLRLPEGL